MHSLILMASVLVSSCAHGQNSVVSCRMQDQYHVSPDQHAAGVDNRGDHAMGFSHETTVHHFILLPDGGTICVEITSEHDDATRDQIRTHLAHIAGLFASGDFDIPMLIHDRVAPGVPVMKAKRTAISYTYQESARGGQVRIRTSDTEALNAIHEFLAFQIQDHRTGDPIKQ
ncbi:MAG TPA: hypothetical protein VGL00_21810 [Terracidiphilus sp.]